jgi:hypothetical protein
MTATVAAAHARWPLVIVVIVFGCGTPVHKVGSSPFRPSATAKQQPEYELSGEGLYARFPAEPTDSVSFPTKPGPSLSTRPDNSLGVAIHILSMSSEGFACGCARSRPLEDAEGQSASQQIDAAQSVASAAFQGAVERSAAKRLGDFEGETLVGEDASGNAQILVAYRLSDGLFMAWVIGHGKNLDRDKASQFFDSLRLHVPWRIRAFPNIGLTLALPTVAMEVALPNETDFAVGGVGELSYSIAVSAGGPEQLWPPEPPQLSGLNGSDTRNATLKILSSKQIEHDGEAARDVVLQQGDRYGRVQYLTTSGRAYRIAIGSKSFDRMDDNDARRFFESIRIFN